MDAVRIVFTRPLLIIPVVLQFCFLYGAFFFGTLAAVFFASAVATPTDPFSEMIQVILFVLTYAQNPNPTIPAALANAGTLSTTITNGILSWKMLVLFLIITCFCLLAALSSAYAKALTLGVIRDGAKRQRTGFMDFWRNGRTFWSPATHYYIPFAIIGAVFITAGIPVAAHTFGTYIIEQQASPQLPGIVFILVAIAGIALLLRIFTLLADALIVAGSKQPVREATAFTFRYFSFSFVTAIVLLGAAVVMFAINVGLDYAAGLGYILSANVAWLLLLAIWRLWVSAYVVVRGQRRIPV